MGHLSLFTSDPNHIKIGNGKTLLMTMYAYDRMVYENYSLLSNYDVEFVDERIDADELDKVLKEEFKSIILIDELPTFFDAYSGVDSTENEVRNVLNQARKRRIHIWGTAQVMNEVPRHIRRKISAIYLITKIHKLNSKWEYCEEPINSKCESDTHKYKIDRLNGMTKIVSPHLQKNGEIIKDFFYDQYDTNQILMSNR